MTFESLVSNRIKFKNNLENDISVGKTLLLKQFENVKLSDFLNNLSVCIQKLKRSTEILEETLEKLSLEAGKDDEEDILHQIEIDFDCLNLAYDIRIELEVLAKETQRNINTSTIQDRFDRLLEQTQAQLHILKQNQQLLMGLDNKWTGEYSLSSATYSEQFSNEYEKEEHIDNTSSVLSNSLRGKRDDVGIIMTNASNIECKQNFQAKCQRINAVSSLDRALGTGKKYQEQNKRKWNMVVDAQSLARTLVYQKSVKQRTKRKQMGQKRRSPACLMKTLKPIKWRKSPFLRRLRRRKPIIWRGKRTLQKRRQRIVRKKNGNYTSRYGYTRWNNAPSSSKRHMTVKQQRLLMHMRWCSNISNETSGQHKGSRQRPKVTKGSTTKRAKRPNRRAKSLFRNNGRKNTQKSENDRNLINDENCKGGETDDDDDDDDNDDDDDDDDDDKLLIPESWTNEKTFCVSRVSRILAIINFI